MLQGPAASGSIGAAGGEVTSADGLLQISVPPGAFAHPTQVTILSITNTAHGGRGQAYRITPEGLQGAVPLTLRFQVDDAMLQGSALDVMSIATQDADGRWHAYRQPVRDKTKNTLEVQTTHFSDWAVIAGAQLRPATATVPVGQSIDFILVTCAAQAESNGITATVDACTERPAAVGELSDWAVNSILGGAAALGTITELALTGPAQGEIPHRARFDAPLQVPAHNPVAVSVRYHELAPGAQPVTLVSNVLITRYQDCQWLRDAGSLHFEIELEYHYNGPGPEGPTSLSQSGIIRGELQSMYQNDFQGAWQGITTQGTAFLNDQVAKGDDTLRLSGSGAPAVGSGIDAGQSSGAQLVVNYSDCTYHFGGRITVLASSGKPNDPPRVTEVGNFALNGFVPIDRVDGIGGFHEMPLRQEAKTIGTYSPGGLGNGVTDGKAMARWIVHRMTY
ncbi:hypothetical protein [Massilia horti]|uniref:ZU5 domain-containing protein n=1 Tax=Massilia horti TaxID=2562153 RepID=A0A4Y9T5E8_9BURK|nr:hypothetical protein [Massilia horti]TFW32239.1 hypothetical protein E4O92_10500 [Massilia horti]